MKLGFLSVLMISLSTISAMAASPTATMFKVRCGGLDFRPDLPSGMSIKDVFLQGELSILEEVATGVLDAEFIGSVQDEFMIGNKNAVQLSMRCNGLSGTNSAICYEETNSLSFPVNLQPKDSDLTNTRVTASRLVGTEQYSITKDTVCEYSK